MVIEIKGIEHAVDGGPGYQDQSTPQTPEIVLVIGAQGLSDALYAQGGVRRVYEALDSRPGTVITSPGDYALIQKSLMRILEKHPDSERYAELLLDRVTVVEPEKNLITSIEDVISDGKKLKEDVMDALKNDDEALRTRHAGRIDRLIRDYCDAKRQMNLKKPNGIRQETFLEYAERRLDPDPKLHPKIDVAYRLGAAIKKAGEGAVVFVTELRDTDKARFQEWVGTFYPDVSARIKCDANLKPAYA
ncbi:MAG: hypothetical protein ABIE94_00570 [archaeon]